MSFWLFIFPILPLTAPSLHSLILPLLTLQHVSAFPALFKLCLNTLHLLKLFHDHFTYPQVNMPCLHDHLQLQKASPIHRSTCLAHVTISSFQKASPIYRSTCLAHIATSSLPLLYNTSPKEVSSLHVLCLLPNKHLSPAAYLNFNFHGLVFTSMKWAMSLTLQFLFYFFILPKPLSSCL